MSRSSKSMFLLLQRCVAVRKVTLPAAIKTRWSSVLSARSALVQQPTWTSTTRGVCPLQSAVTTSQYRFCTKAGEPWEDEYPPLPAYQSDPKQEKGVYIMEVRGLPWGCSAEDLLQFFSDCRIRDGVKGIHLSGQAFIVMEHEDDVRKALEKDRQYLGTRCVKVFEVTNSNAEAILKEAPMASAESGGVVRITGLPYYYTKDDIVQFFSGLDIEENGITMVMDHKGRYSGEAFVEFSSQQAANEALQRNQMIMGRRYVEVFPSRRDQINSSKTEHSAASGYRTGSAGSSAPPNHLIHMRGLPFQVSTDDIVKFFAPLEVLGVVMGSRPGGRPSGCADVYFSCHQDASNAMSRDRMYIGERYVELFLSSESDK
ncbi:G-rich sequence factor 1 [Spinachia spinachia]